LITVLKLKKEQIHVGDEVVRVDDREVHEVSVANMLISSDRAGSVVDLVIREKTTGVRVHVPLYRVQHKIQFSQRLGDHDLKIVVETTQQQWHLNLPSLSPDALQHAQAVPGKNEPCVDDLCEPTGSTLSWCSIVGGGGAKQCRRSIVGGGGGEKFHNQRS